MSRLFGYVFGGLSDPRPDAGTDALLELAAQIRALGIPIVVTDAAGRVAAFDNVPPAVATDTAAVHRFVARLDAVNEPIVQPGVGTMHCGSVPIPARLGVGAARRWAGLLGRAGPGRAAVRGGAGAPVVVAWAVEALGKRAVVALGGGGGRVEVRVEAGGARAAARVSVRDDGPGIAAAVRAQLFEPGVSTKPGGWGMGLALARRIVEQQHHGRIQYHAAATGGSEIVLEFPLVDTP